MEKRMRANPLEAFPVYGGKRWEILNGYLTYFPKYGKLKNNLSS